MITFCYDEDAKKQAKLAQARFMRKVAKLLPKFQVEFRFNAGGIAVWGETYVKVTQDAKPVIEACLSKDHSYIRQWDGNHSGRNIQIATTGSEAEIKFAERVHTLSGMPFRAS